jgi:predicted AAA+ superfamily ATPase
LHNFKPLGRYSPQIFSPDEFLSQHAPPVIIDEIQYAPKLLRHIKIAADASAKKGRFFLTGSQSFPLMQGVSKSLAGRVGIINLMTLDAGEVAGARRRFSLEDYIMRGGYPALHAGVVKNAREWFPSYAATYLERDVRNVLNVRSLRDYGRFLRAVALRTARVLSLSDLARDVGIAPNTAKAWLSILQSSGPVFLLEPYHRNMGKRPPDPPLWELYGRRMRSTRSCVPLPTEEPEARRSGSGGRMTGKKSIS